MAVFSNITNSIAVTHNNFSTCLSSNYATLSQALNKALGKSWSFLQCEGWKHACTPSKLIGSVNSFHQQLQWVPHLCFPRLLYFSFREKNPNPPNHKPNTYTFIETNQSSGDILMSRGWCFLPLPWPAEVWPYLLCLLQSWSWHLWPPRLCSL